MTSMLSASLRFYVLVQILGATISKDECIIPATGKRIKKECLPRTSEFKTFDCIASESIRIPCVDEHKQCSEWAKKGECKKNPQYMMVKCRKSCSSCIPLHSGDETQIADERTRSDVLRRLYETQEYLHNQADRNVETLHRCINKHSECTHWWYLGECERNPHFMHKECSPACQTCEKVV
mmetsp:Transcript_12000/g.28465  ORF Transcript_12000/g.28465 Transcript_12000/m.28465 type:complete len:180 (-) Transcript_12000:296-835(-)